MPFLVLVLWISFGAKTSVAGDRRFLRFCVSKIKAASMKLKKRFRSVHFDNNQSYKLVTKSGRVINAKFIGRIGVEKANLSEADRKSPNLNKVLDSEYHFLDLETGEYHKFAVDHINDFKAEGDLEIFLEQKGKKEKPRVIRRRNEKAVGLFDQNRNKTLVQSGKNHVIVDNKFWDQLDGDQKSELQAKAQGIVNNLEKFEEQFDFLTGLTVRDYPRLIRLHGHTGQSSWAGIKALEVNGEKSWLLNLQVDPYLSDWGLGASVYFHERAHQLSSPFAVEEESLTPLLADGAFNEALADVLSAIHNRDPVIGRAFFANPVPVRDIRKGHSSKAMAPEKAAELRSKIKVDPKESQEMKKIRLANNNRGYRVSHEITDPIDAVVGGFLEEHHLSIFYSFPLWSYVSRNIKQKTNEEMLTELREFIREIKRSERGYKEYRKGYWGEKQNLFNEETESLQRIEFFYACLHNKSYSDREYNRVYREAKIRFPSLEWERIESMAQAIRMHRTAESRPTE